MRQSQTPYFLDTLTPLNLVEDGPSARIDLRPLVFDDDSDFEDLRFSVTTDSAQIQLQVEQGELVATPVVQDYWGELVAKLTVTDPTGLKSDALLPITVQPRNDSPRIISTPDTLVAADLPFIYQLEATDSDSDSLTFSLIDGPQGVAFDHTRHQVKWQSPVPGLYSIAFAVSDGDATSHQRFQIRVFIPDSSIRFISQPITQTRRGQLYTYQPQVANENDFPLSFSLVTSPQRMRIDHQTGMITWIATDADLNLAKIELKVSGGGQQETQRFQINLIEGNAAPVIISTPPEVAWTDSLYIYALDATDADGDSLIYSVAQGPPGIRINPLIGLVAWAPEEDDLGIHEIELNAYDGQETTAQHYQLHVQRPSYPPQIQPLKGVALDAASGFSTLIELNPLVTDPDHEDRELVWSFTPVSGDPITVGYDPIAQTARITASEDFSIAQIHLIVRDPDDHRAERTLNLGLREEGDFNSDTAIDLTDFFRLVDVFGTVADTPEWDSTADLNSDGQIDFDDFFVFIDRYEKSNSLPGN